MTAAPPHPDLLNFAAQIVAAHVSHNAVSPEALPGVIQSVYAALSSLGIEAPTAQKPVPAVPINKSVFPDHIVCLEDGKKLKMLKRHLGVSYGMTPEAYRTRWGLPPDYPMVAPKYAAQRSALAKKIGLGSKPSVPAAPISPPIQKLPERARGRGVARKQKTA
jgi:predicted transcriptional regulator